MSILITAIIAAIQISDMTEEIKRYSLMVAVAIILFILLVQYYSNRLVIKTKKLDKKSKDVINSASSVAIFGGTLSWAEKYLPDIKNAKKVEIFLPSGHYEDNLDGVKEKVSSLREFADIYLTKNETYLRCIIANPDDETTIKIMVKKKMGDGKYAVFNYSVENREQATICKMYSEYYKSVKRDCAEGAPNCCLIKQFMKRECVNP